MRCHGTTNSKGVCGHCGHRDPDCYEADKCRCKRRPQPAVIESVRDLAAHLQLCDEYAIDEDRQRAIVRVLNHDLESDVDIRFDQHGITLVALDAQEHQVSHRMRYPFEAKVFQDAVTVMDGQARGDWSKRTYYAHQHQEPEGHGTFVRAIDFTAACLQVSAWLRVPFAVPTLVVEEWAENDEGTTALINVALVAADWPQKMAQMMPSCPHCGAQHFLEEVPATVLRTLAPNGTWGFIVIATMTRFQPEDAQPTLRCAACGNPVPPTLLDGYRE